MNRTEIYNNRKFVNDIIDSLSLATGDRQSLWQIIDLGGHYDYKNSKVHPYDLLLNPEDKKLTETYLALMERYEIARRGLAEPTMQVCPYGTPLPGETSSESKHRTQIIFGWKLTDRGAEVLKQATQASAHMLIFDTKNLCIDIEATANFVENILIQRTIDLGTVQAPLRFDHPRLNPLRDLFLVKKLSGNVKDGVLFVED